jgi:ATP synthase subunit 6
MFNQYFNLISVLELNMLKIPSNIMYYYYVYIYNNKIIFLITNQLIIFLIILFIINFIIFITTFKLKYKPNLLQYIIENIYVFTINITQENFDSKTLKYFPIIFSIFIIITNCNLIGIIPYSYTITSQLCITLGIAISSYIIQLYTEIKIKKKYIFLRFLPTGAPLILTFFFIILEFISYISKIFSIAIRLFANIIAGHSLLFLISTFAFITLNILYYFYHFLIIYFIILSLIILLELFINILQSYVFTILCCIYINDTIKEH